MIKHKCFCGSEYEVSEEDKNWRTLKTYCPDCRESLECQKISARIHKIMSVGKKIKYGWILGKEYVLVKDRSSIIYL